METWQQLLKNSLTKPEDIAARFGLPIHEVRRLNKSFKTCITSYYADLIKEKNDPLYRQMVPDSAEL